VAVAAHVVVRAYITIMRIFSALSLAACSAVLSPCRKPVGQLLHAQVHRGCSGTDTQTDAMNSSNPTTSELRSWGVLGV